VIDSRTVQTFLTRKGSYTGKIDGLLGVQSYTSMRICLKNSGVDASTWTPQRIRIAVEQLMMTSANIEVGKIDGIAGPRYDYGLELYQNYLRDIDPSEPAISHQPPIWPRQKDIQKFYGSPGENQVLLVTPYPLYLDWELSTKIQRFSIHEKCHDSAKRVMERVADYYGLERIHELGLDQFGGCLNVRKMRGGSAMSMHSWGIAIDWDANRNTLRMNSSQASLAKAPSAKFLDLWEEEGWISLGRERNFDWMHVQAARL